MPRSPTAFNWVLCSRSLRWHRLALGQSPNPGAAPEPMARLACGAPDTTGDWVIVRDLEELPLLGVLCDRCAAWPEVL